jgi:hypothetical protein
MSETILSERTNKCLKVMASPARSLSVVSWTDVSFWSLPGLPAAATHSIIPLALTSENVLKHTSHGRGEGDKSKSRVDTTSIIQHHHGQLSFFAVTSISLF